MTWIAFLLAFQFGYIPSAVFESYAPPAYVDGSGQFYQLAEARVILFGTLEIGGTMRVQDWIAGGRGFYPNQLDSTFYADIRLGPVTIGWRHECLHPIVPYQPTEGERPAWDGMLNEAYARVEVRF